MGKVFITLAATAWEGPSSQAKPKKTNHKGF
jgi:hypothetical protein